MKMSILILIALGFPLRHLRKKVIYRKNKRLVFEGAMLMAWPEVQMEHT